MKSRKQTLRNTMVAASLAVVAAVSIAPQRAAAADEITVAYFLE